MADQRRKSELKELAENLQRELDDFKKKVNPTQ